MMNPLTWFARQPVEIEHVHVQEENVPLPSIVLIHGAHQSSVTFEYLRHALPGFNYINIEWHVNSGFELNLSEMKEALKNSGAVYLIGHSMGGIYAAHLSESVDCIGGAAISVPWGGSKQADYARYLMPSYQLYKEVSTKSPFVTYARSLKLPGRWTNYVSTEGNVPAMGGQNDCVLTLESMTARKDLYTKFVKATHYEIVMCSDLIHNVGKNFIRASEQHYQTKIGK
jgi:pimeloyl-ACP methyl ester carboxylesterase